MHPTLGFDALSDLVRYAPLTLARLVSGRLTKQGIVRSRYFHRVRLVTFRSRIPESQKFRIEREEAAEAQIIGIVGTIVRAAVGGAHLP